MTLSEKQLLRHFQLVLQLFRQKIRIPHRILGSFIYRNLKTDQKKPHKNRKTPQNRYFQDRYGILKNQKNTILF